MSASEYQKIPGPFKRDPKTKKIVVGDWATPELDLLHGLRDWEFTEKVDGTNIRVIWDGYRVTVRGRTDNATFSETQKAKLDILFAGSVNETLFEQQFGNSAATLYGELYGPGVQSGGKYRNDLDFVLFDVRVGDWWLLRDDIEDVGRGLSVDAAPLLQKEPATLDHAITLVSEGMYSRVALDSKPAIFAEGLVGRLRSGLRARNGERIIVKVKHDDLYIG
jgi:hypothetical protein